MPGGLSGSLPRRLPPGPDVGRILKGLLARAIADPSINARDRLLAAARTLIDQPAIAASAADEPAAAASSADESEAAS